MEKKNLGTNGKCALMMNWWRQVPQEEKLFIKQRQAEFPYLRPCPKTTSAWWVDNDTTCGQCEHAVPRIEADKENAPVLAGTEA